jgi:protoheme IX farnesyltransferase
MKATATPVTTAASIDRGPLNLAAELVKARLNLLVLITTAVGFYLGSESGPQWGLFLSTLVGTGTVAAAAAMLNQWMERDMDARMARTQDRPLPAGRVRAETVLVTGTLGAVAGLLFLLLLVGWATALLGLVTLSIYLFVYTPLKRLTPWNTLVGAIPGALPPLMGWTAARGGDPVGWTLFAVLAFWQIPHFFAIAWMYREDYARAGFAMLPRFDPAGRRTATHAVAYTTALLVASAMPVVFGITGPIYLAGALTIGAYFLWRALQFAKTVTASHARQLFYASIVYLPLLLALMVLDKAR